jgi:hypothetical protein
MIEHSTERFTREEVLRGLQQVIADATGTQLHLTSEMKFGEYVRDHGEKWGLLDFDSLDFIFRLEFFFAIKIPRDALFGIKDEKLQDLTFGMIADYIAERAPFISLRPAWILGKPCHPAGAFRAIQQVVSIRSPKAPEFGPSSNVLYYLGGIRLLGVWSHLQWLSHGRLPDITIEWWNTKTRRLLLRVILTAMLLSFVALGLASWSAGTCLMLWLAAVVGLFLAVCIFGDRMVTKLPAGFVTFRDVAKAMTNGTPATSS